MTKNNNQIIKLEENEVLIFGSNIRGRHGAGAALFAARFLGAQEGVGEGLTGQCYAFPTIEKLRPYTTVSLQKLPVHVAELRKVIAANRNKTFYLSAVGCGLAGYKNNQMAPLFKTLENKTNLFFPPEWKDFYERIW